MYLGLIQRESMITAVSQAGVWIFRAKIIFQLFSKLISWHIREHNQGIPLAAASVYVVIIKKYSGKNTDDIDLMTFWNHSVRILHMLCPVISFISKGIVMDIEPPLHKTIQNKTTKTTEPHDLIDLPSILSVFTCIKYTTQSSSWLTWEGEVMNGMGSDITE